MRSLVNSRFSDFRDAAAAATRSWSPAGYTLIELLIASVLSATLMTITWGLLSMYSGWLTAGRVQSEERQLKRSLLVQLQDDLESAAFADGGRQVQFLESLADETGATAESLVPEDLEDPLVSAMEPSLEAEDVPSWLQSLQLPKDLRGVPGISLTGTATMLRLIVPRQMSADELSAPNTAPVVNGGDGTTETAVAANPAELNTDMQAVQDAATVPGAQNGVPGPVVPSVSPMQIILWQFRPWSSGVLSAESSGLPPVTESASGVLPGATVGPEFSVPESGLTRQVWDGLTLLQFAREQSADAVMLPIDQQNDFNAVTPPLQSARPLEEERIPEVMSAQFEYFDGRRWQSSWKSGGGGGLPVAVRLRLWMISAAAAEELKAQVAAGAAGAGVPLVEPVEVGAAAEIGASMDAGLSASAIPMQSVERIMILQPITGAMPGFSDADGGVPGGAP